MRELYSKVDQGSQIVLEKTKTRSVCFPTTTTTLQQNMFNEFRRFQSSKGKAMSAAVLSSSRISNKEYIKDFEKIEERTKVWIEKKNTGLRKLQQRLEELEFLECTFSPKINCRQNSSSTRRFEERLYNFDSSKKLAKKRNLFRSMQEIELMKTCTFKPIINKSSRKVQPRYLSSKESCHNSCIEPSYNFMPKTNKLKANMLAAKIYTSQNVTERLYPKEKLTTANNIGILPQKNSRASINDQLQTKNVKTDVKENLSEKNVSKAVNFQEFLLRQKRYEEMRKVKLRRIAQAHENPFKPNLSKLAQKQLGVHGVQGIKRHKRIQNPAQLNHLLLSEYDPEVSYPAAKACSTTTPFKCRRKTTRELSYGDRVKREIQKRLLRSHINSLFCS